VAHSEIAISSQATILKMKKVIIIAAFLWAVPMLGQSNTGELRLTVSDPSGLGVKSTVELVSEANQYRSTLTTDEKGYVDFQRLPYGIYRIQIEAPAFANVTEPVEIRSALPLERAIRLKVASVSESVNVSAATTLIDPYRAGSVNQLGEQAIQNRLTAIPGRSMQDLVNTEPGWLYEGNAVLHARGSEYQIQFVVDGIPLTDNRSPGFGPEPADADDVESLKIYTAGIPAEYGRKMGGVVEVNTLKNEDPGFHGQLTMFGGSYDTAGIDTQDQYTWNKNTFSVSGSGNMTEHYLNPVVPENYTNNGTSGSGSASYERELTQKDRLTLIVSHEFARYQNPNELVQENGAYLPNGTWQDGVWQPNADNNGDCPVGAPVDCVFVPGGQLQHGDNFETMGSASYQHIFSPETIGWLRFMARNNSNDFTSNPESWPIYVTQHNYFNEIYFNGSIGRHQGRHEWKAGIESDNLFLHESFFDAIPDCSGPVVPNPTPPGPPIPVDPQCPITLGFFDPGSATSFTFQGSRPDLEQSAYVQDLIRLGNYTVSAGVRWDHYQLLVNQNAVSPRITASRYFPDAGMNVHASYDRMFQPPEFENILLTNSPTVVDIDPISLRQPVLPSHGDYFEAGMTKAFAGKLRFDANTFRRQMSNYSDDDAILNSTIGFPIAFRKAVLYGAEAKVEILHWGKLSGFGSYSWIVGNCWLPVVGGLLLGSENGVGVGPNGALVNTQLVGRIPDSQDQRNTVRTRWRYQVAPRFWIAAGADYNTGLPFEADLSPQQYALEYGQVMVNHLNFNRGRILPYFTQNASVGVDLYQKEKRAIRFQADVANLGNTLELIDFGGLFSGNAIGPARQYTFRLVSTF
jgi:hypothetical protein